MPPYSTCVNYHLKKAHKTIWFESVSHNHCYFAIRYRLLNHIEKPGLTFDINIKELLLFVNQTVSFSVRNNCLE